MAQNSIANKYQVLVIGGSAGCLDVILHILPLLAEKIPLSIILVIHRKNSYDTVLVDLLAAKVKLPVKEVEEKDPILPGNVYVAPSDYHLLFENDHTFSLDDSEKVHYSRPSIDVSFISAADVYKDATIGLLLSGANADGVDGLRAIKERGGCVIVQDPADAEVDFMPKSAISSVKVDRILKASEMASYINKLAQQ